jgi:hypothetical protein
MSDILRGAAQKYEAAATSKAKAEFASIRVQALQDEFARFASDLQSIKAEIMQKHFEPYCFMQQSNIANTPDAQLAEPAIQLLKDQKQARWRIKIRPETLAMADYAQLKQDRVEYLNGISTFMQSAAPLAQMDKDIVPFLLQLLQWGLAGFKGSNEIEGVMDNAIKAFKEKSKNPEPPKSDPQMEKAKVEMQMMQEAHKAKLEQQAQKAQADMAEQAQNAALEREKIQAQIEQDRQEFELRMAEMQQEFKMEVAKMIFELKAEKQLQEIQVQGQATAAAIGLQEKEHAAAISVESANATARANKSNGGGD